MASLSIAHPVDSFGTVKAETPTDLSSDDYRYIYVTLDVYDAETGEFIRSDKNIKVRVSNGTYEIKFVYGWGKCSRSNRGGYDYYYSDGTYAYYFDL